MAGREVSSTKPAQHDSSWVIRLPLSLAKLACFILLAFTGYLSVTSESLEDRVLNLGFVFILATIYTNLAFIKQELKELFRPPLEYYGYPILVCGTLCSVWYEYLRW